MQQEHIDDVSKHIRLERKCGFYELYIKRLMDIVCSLAAIIVFIIKFHYPILQKHRWLTPIMEVRRWGKLIFCGHLKRTVKELKYNSTISEDAAAEAKTLLKNVGL